VAAVQDDAVQGGAIVLAFASYSMATDVALALVIVLALAIVLALQSAIEPNFIPPEIKQRALPQTRPYDDCVAVPTIICPNGSCWGNSLYVARPLEFDAFYHHLSEGLKGLKAFSVWKQNTGKAKTPSLCRPFSIRDSHLHIGGRRTLL